MKVHGLALTPPPGFDPDCQVTPELLAACLARYSRSNLGIEAILAGIDRVNPEKAVEGIFRFVDYGHASIGGLTGGIAMVVDGCSMLLAYKLFEIAQLADGQESSTRYIVLDESNLPTPEELGVPGALAGEWRELMGEGFRLYNEVAAQLDAAATARPELVRAPAGALARVVERLRRNYALDRARYFIPLATRTNVALVMTARVWAESIRQLDALGWPEARRAAGLLRGELEKFTPRLIRHSHPDEAATAQAANWLSGSQRWIREQGVGTENLPDEVFVAVERSAPPFLPAGQSVPDAFRGKTNRYSITGEAIRRMFVRAGWNNVALAELRDLNRHRSGCRFTPLIPAGFFLPPDVRPAGLASFLARYRALVVALASADAAPGAHFYGYFLGTQTPFEHSTHADKFIYEVELRTGLGAHFRYAEHLAAAHAAFLRQVPEAAPYVQVGSAEPE